MFLRARLILQGISLRQASTKICKETAIPPDCSNNIGGGDSLFQRPVRAEFPGKVRFGFIPDEWYTMFYHRTGVTGPYAFGVGLMTYLCSKEIYVFEHNFYCGISVAIIVTFLIKKIGPMTAAYCDKEIDRIEGEWKQNHEENIKELEDLIKHEETEQWRAEGHVLLMEAKQENVALQLEAAYRARIVEVYTEVKRRLDFQVACHDVQRNIYQKHMVTWIVDHVLSDLTAARQNEVLNSCLRDLDALALNVDPNGSVA